MKLQLASIALLSFGIGIAGCVVVQERPANSTPAADPTVEPAAPCDPTATATGDPTATATVDPTATATVDPTAQPAPGAGFKRPAPAPTGS